MNEKLCRIGIFFVIFVMALNRSALVAQAQNAPAPDDRVSFEIAPDHVGISVPNAEESAAWYHKMLGFEVDFRMKQGDGMTVVHIKRGNFNIELFQIDGAKPLPEYRRDPSADLRVNGLAHFAFRVSDAQAAIKELKTKGAEIAMGPIDTPGVVFVFVRDNAGNCFELIQYKNRPSTAR
jgi:methylmalonyl-CoA/ethylmalonyl-CoA epimerase